MRIVSVQLTNVRQHKAMKLDFAPGVVVLQGENGVGKTTVIEAIAWAMFDAPRGKQGDLVPLGTKKEAKVRVEFSHDGKFWAVERSTKKGLKVFEGDRPVAVGKRDSLAQIRGALSLPGQENLAALYRDALGPPQGQLTQGFGLSPAARQDFWGPVLKLDGYREAFGNLRGPLRTLETQTAAKLAEIAATASQHRVLNQAGIDEDQRLAEIPELVRGVTFVIQDLEKERVAQDEKLAEMRVLVAQASQVMEEKVRLSDRLGRLHGEGIELMEIEKEVAQIPEEEERKAVLEGRVDENVGLEYVLVGRTIAVLLTTIEGSRRSLEDLVRERDVQQQALEETRRARIALGDLGLSLASTQFELEKKNARALYLDDVIGRDVVFGGVCPTCGSELTEDHMMELREEREQASIEFMTLQLELVNLDLQRSSLQTVVNEKNVIIAAVPVDSRIVAVQGGIEGMKEVIVRQTKEMENATVRESELKDAVLEQQHIRTDLSRVTTYLANLGAKKEHLDKRGPAIRVELQEVSTRMKGLEAQEAKGVPTQQEVADQHLEVEALLNKVRSKQDEVRALEVEMEDVKRAKALSVKLALFKGELLEIERKTTLLSEYREAINQAGPIVAEHLVAGLSSLANDHWQAMGKSGTLTWDGTYALEVDGKSFVSHLSGGEGVAAALAVRLALADYLANLNFMVLDEPTIHLGLQARMGLADVLRTIRLEQLIVVSHDMTFSSAATQVIQLREDRL